MILGRDFLIQNKMAIRYSEIGKCILDYKQQELVATITFEENPCLKLRSSVTIPGRTLAVLNVKVSPQELKDQHICEVQISNYLQQEHPNLQMVPTIHKIDKVSPEEIPFTVVNISTEEVYIDKGEIMGYLTPQEIDISEVQVEATLRNDLQEEVREKELPELVRKKRGL